MDGCFNLTQPYAAIANHQVGVSELRRVRSRCGLAGIVKQEVFDAQHICCVECFCAVSSPHFY